MQEKLQKTILESEVPVLVYVKHTKCSEQLPEELKIEEKIKQLGKKVNLIALCYPDGTVPFPAPQWNLVYFFEPGNLTFLLSVDVIYLLKDFEDIFTSFEAMVANIPLETYKAQKETPEKIEEVRKMVEEEDISKYPSTFQMTRNLLTQAWKSTKEVINSGQLIVDAKTAQKRYSICESCPLFEKKDKRCTECGCFMGTKVHLQAAECPKSKW